MELFKEDVKLGDIIIENYHLLPILNRFGIQLGFRDKTVKDICREKGINMDFFLDIINAFHNKDYFPETELRSFPPKLFIEYLKKTHEYYLGYIMPKLEELLNGLLDSCGQDCGQLNTINTFYKKYKTELLEHIKHEEQAVFPYIEMLSKAYKQNNPALVDPSSKISVEDFENDHVAEDMELHDLKNLVIKYLEPTYNTNAGNEFLFALCRFERDIKDHIRIEYRILVPMLNEMKKALGNA